MAKGNPDFFAVLDIGSSKVACLVATRDKEQTIHTHALVTQAAKGVRSGAIVDMDAAAEVVLSTIQQAEDESGLAVPRVMANMNASAPYSATVTADVTLDNTEINRHDIQRLLASVPPPVNGVEQQLLHKIPVDYVLDGARHVLDPKGMMGQSLKADIHVVSVPANDARTLATCLRRAQVEPTLFIASAYAAGLACLTKDEQELGAIVVDIGAGTTSLALFDQQRVKALDRVAIGSHHITMDIAHGLSTTISNAERLKILHGAATPNDGEGLDTIEIPQIGDADTDVVTHQPRSQLLQIITPRLEEILELAGERVARLDTAPRATKLPVVITGGGAQLPGLVELAGKMWHRKVRLGRPRKAFGLDEEYRTPSLSGVIGMLRVACDNNQWRPNHDIAYQIAPSALGRVSRWFRQNF